MTKHHRTPESSDPLAAFRLNQASTHAGQGLRDLRDAISRLQEIEKGWVEGRVPDSIALNNAGGRVADAAWHLGSALAIVQSAPQASNEDLLAALQGDTYFTEARS
jgi:hypothetical protein